MAGVTTALVAIPSEASASTTCSTSLTGTSTSYWNCNTTDGWTYFRAVAPCYQSNTRTNYTVYGSWVAISNKATHSTATCTVGVRQGDPTIQFK
jgi:hypothetical protein